PHVLHSFPTRRSSDLVAAAVLLLCLAGTIEGLLSASDAAPAYKFAVSAASAVLLACYLASGWSYLRSRASAAAPGAATGATGTRSEEHTSELQSPCNL